jgi:hypothetical protein
MQKFSFQKIENSRIKIAVDRTTADIEDPDHWDKLPRNTDTSILHHYFVS